MKWPYVLATAKGMHGGGFNRGGAKVYEVTEAGMVKVGGDINGLEDMDRWGENGGAISASGTRVVLSSTSYNDQKGGVAVFELNAEGTWEQLGDTITGLNDPKGGFGASVDISADGDTIVVGIPNDDFDGTVNVYRWDGSSWNIDTPTGIE